MSNSRFDHLELDGSSPIAPQPVQEETVTYTDPVSFPKTGKLVTTAHKQWLHRPQDERFDSVQDLLRFLEERTAKTKEVEKPFKIIKVEPRDTDVMVATDKGVASLTHHSFTQLAQLANLHASGLRASFTAFLETKEAAKWVSDGLNLGLQGREKNSGSSMSANILVTAQHGKLTIRSINTGEYSRVWDVDVVKKLVEPLQEFGFVNPPAFDGPGGLYAGDRDMFALMVPRNVARINMKGVTCNVSPKPIEVNGQLFYPFIMIQGSEVGGSAQKFITGLLQAVCANLMLWGVDGMEELTIRHTGNPWERIMKAYSEFLNRWVIQDQRKQENRIALAMNKTFDSVKEAQEIVSRKTGLPQKVIQSATDLILRGDRSTGIISEDPTNLWNMVAAITAQARLRLNQDDQVDVATRAGKLMLLAR